MTVKACINDMTWLHIKNGKLSWIEATGGYAPGTHFDCKPNDVTKVNGKEWKDWQIPFQLDFNTDGLEVKAKVSYGRDVAKVQQSPSKINDWETIFYYNDPSPGAWNYTIIFTFCTPGHAIKSKNNITAPKKDSIKPLVPEIKKNDKKIEFTEDIICKVNFEVGKNLMTKNSESDLSKLSEMLKTNNLFIEISGYKTGTGELKLYEERSLVIDNFLVSKGIDQKRIKYIGYGDGNKKPPTQKTIKCCVIIN